MSLPMHLNMRNSYINCMGTHIFVGNPLLPGIAHLYLADRAKHDELAAEWTLRFAK